MVFEGISVSHVVTDRLTARVLTAGDLSGDVVVFVHGNVSSSVFFQPVMLKLAARFGCIAIDLRGFGGSQSLPVDATRGLKDFSDDVASVLKAMGVGGVHVIGWSMGGGIVMELMQDHSSLLRSVTLLAPVSPYGFGATDEDGELLDPLASGAGAGGANPHFVAALAGQDRSADSPAGARNVYRTTYVKNPEGMPFEDIWVEAMLSTVTGTGNYPGSSTTSPQWPGFAPGGEGVLNTMAPTHFNASGIVDVERKPPILWIHGSDDVIVSDDSLFDINHLGQIGAIPGWPGPEVAPNQPMKRQTRMVLDRYRGRGGEVTEVEFADCGHSPHLEKEAEFIEVLERFVERADPSIQARKAQEPSKI